MLGELEQMHPKAREGILAGCFSTPAEYSGLGTLAVLTGAPPYLGVRKWSDEARAELGCKLGKEGRKEGRAVALWPTSSPAVSGRGWEWEWEDTPHVTPGPSGRARLHEHAAVVLPGQGA